MLGGEIKRQSSRGIVGIKYNGKAKMLSSKPKSNYYVKKDCCVSSE